MELIILGWLLTISYLIGNRILVLLGLSNQLFDQRFGYSMGIGIAILLYLVLGLGFVGLLTSSFAYGLCALLLIFSIWGLINQKEVYFLRALLANAQLFLKKIPNFFFDLGSLSILYLVLVFVFLINLSSALTPELRHDALQYHLSIPHYYCLHKKITEVPFNIYHTYSLNAEMLYTLALLLKNCIVAKLLHFSIAVISAIVVFQVAKQHFNKTIAVIASTIFYTLPQVAWMSSTAFNENFWLFFGILSVSAFLNWLKFNNIFHLLLAGFFGGLGIGTKLPAVVFYPFLISIFLALIVIKQKKTIVQFLKFKFIYLLAVILPPLPWLIRNYVYTHNPFYPLLNNILRPAGIYYRIAGDRFYAIRHLPSVNLLDYLIRMKQAFIAINTNGNGIISAFFLVSVPLLVIKTVPKEVKFFTLYSLFAWLIYCFIEGGTDGRFIYPTYPIMAIPIGFTLGYLIEKFPNLKKFIIYTLSLVLLATFCHMKYAFTLYFQESPYPILTEKQQNDYLNKLLPIYPVYSYINKNLSREDKLILPSGYAALYCNRKYIANSEFDVSPLEAIQRSISNCTEKDKELLSRLEEWKVTHIVLEKSFFENTDELKKFLKLKSAPIYQSGTFILYKINYNKQ